MIDFRYHLVSLIAVFLAVALGIVIGTTQLNGVTLDNLQGQVTSLQQDKRALENQTHGLQTQLNNIGGFEEAVGPTLVADSLTDRSVLLVIGSGNVPAGVVEGVTALLGSAGATVTGSIRLTDSYNDPQTASSLQNYVTGPGLPPGATLPPDTSDTGELVAALLADVLMVPPTGTAPSDAATASVLAGLNQLNVLSRDTSTVTPADFAVVLTSGSYTDKDADARNMALVQLVSALDRQGSGVVVAGDPVSAGSGGLVGALRDDPTVSPTVSTVDNVDSAAGRISTVLALSAEGRGISGKYGVGKGTQSVPPAT